MSQSAEILKQLKAEVAKVIVGQDKIVDRLIVCLLADGHALLEGVPGLAKTKLLETLTSCIQADMSRIQFTPDLLPSDLIGTELFVPNKGDFITRQGPLFCNLLLADEINRAPAKVQSALLQAMQEREVTIGHETFSLPEVFMVLATQNPIEQEGTYKLPEAQLDRFLLMLKVDYPSYDEELDILRVTSQERSEPASIKPVMDTAGLVSLREECLKVNIDPKIDRYIVSIVQATRKAAQYDLDQFIDWGASPRASIALKRCSQAMAFLQGRSSVIPEDVKDLATDVLRHRILVSFEAEAQEVDSDEVIRILLNNIAIP